MEDLAIPRGCGMFLFQEMLPSVQNMFDSQGKFERKKEMRNFILCPTKMCLAEKISLSIFNS